MWGAVPLSSQVLDEEKRFIAGMEERARQARPDVDLDKLQKQFEQGMSVWRPKFKKFMQEALSSACERPYIEAAAFFEAFGKAVVMKPDDLLTERTMGVGEKICWTMFVEWQQIERLESVAQIGRASCRERV